LNGESNWAKGDIALLSNSPGGSTSLTVQPQFAVECPQIDAQINRG